MKFPFIVLYGAPNLGKTLQSKLLAEKLNAHYVKYPVYDIAPTGALINAALREKEDIDPLSFQKLCAQNRRDFEPTLKKMLTEKPVVAEAYKQTGIIGGMQEGLLQEVVEELNSDLLPEDFVIFLDGERFTDGIEQNHRFEMANWNETRSLHQHFANEKKWVYVNANQDREKVHADILHIITTHLPDLSELK